MTSRSPSCTSVAVSRSPSPLRPATPASCSAAASAAGVIGVASVPGDQHGGERSALSSLRNARASSRMSASVCSAPSAAWTTPADIRRCSPWWRKSSAAHGLPSALFFMHHALGPPGSSNVVISAELGCSIPSARLCFAVIRHGPHLAASSRTVPRSSP